MLKLSPKILFLSLSIWMLTNQSFVTATPLECDYSADSEYVGVEEFVYRCWVETKDIFIFDRVSFDEIKGYHDPRYTNVNVNGLVFNNIPNLKFFPRILENIFIDLIVLQVVHTSLQEIKQDDIKIFPKLLHLNLQDNKITTIDENLFEFNRKLRAIYLNVNQITQIDPNVFDHLSDLSTLVLSENKCRKYLTDTYKSRSNTLELVQQVRNAGCSLNNVYEVQEQVIHHTTTSTPQVGIKEYEVSGTTSSSIYEMQETIGESIKVKTCNKLNAEMNQNIVDLTQNLNDLRVQSENDLNKIQELTSANYNLTMKLNNLQKKYEDALESKLTLSKNLNDKLSESNKKLNEWKDKYIVLLNTKLVESEKVNKQLNEKIKNINKAISADHGHTKNEGQKKSIVGGFLTVSLGSNQCSYHLD